MRENAFLFTLGHLSSTHMFGKTCLSSLFFLSDFCFRLSFSKICGFLPSAPYYFMQYEAQEKRSIVSFNNSLFLPMLLIISINILDGYENCLVPYLFSKLKSSFKLFIKVFWLFHSFFLGYFSLTGIHSQYFSSVLSQKQVQYHHARAFFLYYHSYA
jgi:hypothetical protein